MQTNPRPTLISKLARVALNLAGWRLLEQPLPGPRGIILAYPHTSNWDFIVGILFKAAMGWEMRFWAKGSLLNIPVFGAWMRWVGAVPVNRSAASGLVQDTVLQMASATHFWLALAPEGTRAYVNGWRMGFFHVWQSAQVPLGLAVIDYGRKEVGLKGFLDAREEEPDVAFRRIEAMLDAPIGRRPNLASPVTPYQRESKDETTSP